MLRDVDLEFIALVVVKVISTDVFRFCRAIVNRFVANVTGHVVPGGLLQGVEALRGVAIAQQLEVGSECAEGFCIQEA
ncbi:hypothetical protein D3C75_792690 [compost metagenome]